jgi:hypothetical protein
MLHQLRVSLAIAALLVVSGRAAFAQNTVTVSGNPALMRVNTAVAGSQPNAVVNASTTYTVRVTTGQPRKITGRLMTALPAGATLVVNLAAPPGATSLGPVALTTTEQDLVINIPRPTNSTRTITYTFSATVLGGVIPNSNRVVRLRLRVN